MNRLSLFTAFIFLLCCLWSTEGNAGFNKRFAWGKRDYSCLVFDTPKEGSRVRANEIVELKWSIGDCGFSGNEITEFDLHLYNSLESSFASGAPLIKYSYNTKIAKHIPNNKFSYRWRVPNVEKKDINPDLFYIRVTTFSKSNPQNPSLFGISGPFTIIP
ncbi:hypothetical protein K493DRAFT_300019 [Basidiobolus meristosporus CBS 931.73]|uniref:Reelin domain-containing protein n=1 Tax=Basidiobolus meristosporus CBS 931.73 TaxID=1314790 RepID=A0A1Y1YKB3_9FUNG|nr:hypothetical protein K493DRAFT_300019 [Basidiobolus meristosporus CBS 931.73]|eukprot:ORX98283.1 hypothetical protein K493DRAFT_300019 [Basidiobolus meristosporus CBS 931.73]